jgi:hypothetical protein
MHENETHSRGPVSPGEIGQKLPLVELLLIEGPHVRKSPDGGTADDPQILNLLVFIVMSCFAQTRRAVGRILSTEGALSGGGALDDKS